MSVLNRSGLCSALNRFVLSLFAQVQMRLIMHISLNSPRRRRWASLACWLAVACSLYLSGCTTADLKAFNDVMGPVAEELNRQNLPTYAGQAGAVRNRATPADNQLRLCDANGKNCSGYDPHAVDRCKAAGGCGGNANCKYFGVNHPDPRCRTIGSIPPGPASTNRGVK